MCPVVQTSAKEYTVFDSDIAGFGVRVLPSGGKSFIIKYRNAEGRQRLFTLGKYGPLTVTMARKLAMQHIGSVAKQVDPAEDRKATKHTALTIAALCERRLIGGDRYAGRPYSDVNNRSDNVVHLALFPSTIVQPI